VLQTFLRFTRGVDNLCKPYWLAPERVGHWAGALKLLRPEMFVDPPTDVYMATAVAKASLTEQRLKAETAAAAGSQASGVASSAVGSDVDVLAAMFASATTLAGNEPREQTLPAKSVL
jgi:hypothetical protein